MTSITLTYTFASNEELAAHVALVNGAAPAATTKVDSKPATTTKAAPKAEAKPEKSPEVAKPKHTRDEMEAALNALKDKKGIEAAKGVIKSAGGVDKKAEIPDDKVDAVFDAATAAAAEEEADM